MKTVREETIARQPELHSIVPVSVSAELTESEKSALSSSEKIIIRKNGIEIELPSNSSDNIISAMFRGLKEC